MLKGVLDVLLPSVCSIFRSDPSGTLKHCGREEGGEEGSQTPTSMMLLCLKSNFCLLSTGRCCWGSLLNIATSTLWYGKEAGIQPCWYHHSWSPSLLLLELSSLTELWSMDQKTDFMDKGIGEVGFWHPSPPLPPYRNVEERWKNHRWRWWWNVKMISQK